MANEFITVLSLDGGAMQRAGDKTCWHARMLFMLEIYYKYYIWMCVICDYILEKIACRRYDMGDVVWNVESAVYDMLQKFSPIVKTNQESLRIIFDHIR